MARNARQRWAARSSISTPSLATSSTSSEFCEQRDNKTFDYLVLLFSDGSHLCQCRTLQTLGLLCRHLWGAMLHSPDFRFHVGLLHEHRLTETARGTPQQE
ncbi:unnamed protein product [Pylaiella littoralis]